MVDIHFLNVLFVLDFVLNTDSSILLKFHEASRRTREARMSKSKSFVFHMNANHQQIRPHKCTIKN